MTTFESASLYGGVPLTLVQEFRREQQTRKQRIISRKKMSRYNLLEPIGNQAAIEGGPDTAEPNVVRVVIRDANGRSVGEAITLGRGVSGVGSVIVNDTQEGMTTFGEFVSSGNDGATTTLWFATVGDRNAFHRAMSRVVRQLEPDSDSSATPSPEPLLAQRSPESRRPCGGIAGNGYNIEHLTSSIST